MGKSVASQIAIKLPANTKRAWVKALRSGEFKQTTGSLMKTLSGIVGGGTAYCCLGVLCRTMRVPVSIIGDHCTIVGNGILSEESRVEQCLNQEFNDEPLENYLTDLNDHKNRSFKQIASWIERNL